MAHWAQDHFCVWLLEIGVTAVTPSMVECPLEMDDDLLEKLFTSVKD